MTCKKSNDKINKCVKCGSDDIQIRNCGYSSFNAGSGKCQNCGNKVVANNGSWSKDDWIIKEWNYQNPGRKEEIRRLEGKITKLKEKIKEVKAREW